MIQLLKIISYLSFAFLLSSNTIKAQEEENYVDDRGYIVKIGDLAKDFSINYADGRKSEKLSDLKGQVVMLQFTASWCGVCRKEMPHIESEIWQKYKDKGLRLLGVDLKEKLEKVKSFSKKMKITYPLVLDEKGEIFELYAHPKAGVTRNILIDKEGKIVFLTRLYEKKEFNELISKIDVLINE